MPEEITDQERSELQNEKEVKKKKEMTIDEIMKCPTWDCNGGPEVDFEYELPGGAQVWRVWCPECRGWISYFISKGNPYEEGARIWENMRREQGA